MREDLFTDIGGISIHFSSDCNMACKYCYIEKDKQAMATYNRTIRNSLEDGSFAQTIKDVFQECRDQIEDLSLWGAEPTINSKYFTNFIYELLDYFPNAHHLMFSTNALLGGELIYNDFVIPLINYANNKNYKVEFELQFSLDGPPEYNDDSRHKGATDTTLRAMSYICTNIPKDTPNFNLTMTTKTTLDVAYIRDMVAGGITKVQWYFDFFNSICNNLQELIKDKSSINIDGVSSTPTLVDPGWHTVDDGKALAAWIKLLKDVDYSNYVPRLQRLLFIQPFRVYLDFFKELDPLANGAMLWSCCAGKTNLTIDHDGHLYSCNRLARNIAVGGQEAIKESMKSNTNILPNINFLERSVSEADWAKRRYGIYAVHDNLLTRWSIAEAQIMLLAKCGQIDEKYITDRDARLLLFLSGGVGLYCHIGAEEDYTGNPMIAPFSYWRYLGNGAIDAWLEYYQLKALKGEI